MQRLIVVADNSLILEAISIGLRHSGEFRLLGQVDARSVSWRSVVEAAPDVVLLDEMDRSEEPLALIRRIKAAAREIAVIVLTMEMDPDWLDAIFDAGAGGAISKSTHPLALATLVRETVNGHVVHGYKRLTAPADHAAQRASDEDSALTMRELEVLRLVAAGATNGEIARALWVTEQTVKFHLSNVYRKLNVTNRTEASHYAHVNGLVSPPLVVVS